ncbi:MAG: Rpn family recombination-promoting nuclease/putative transposase, partial [Lachnospiraceae bacterium]|nr:Rpn family recombination-promoting nuclease/putative transposase [Lachnospiraceae bacterium]
MSNKAKIREEARKLNPIDDLMFRKMAEDKEFCQEILRVILEDDKLMVIESIPQWTGTNLQGRSVILDAKCVKGDGTQVDVEVQKADDDDHQRRVRYNGAILTTNIADPGIKFEKVPDVCVVFISKFDIFEGNLPLYHVDRIVRETGKVVDNGFEEIYVNTKIKDDSEVAELMTVFVDDNAYNSKFPKTSDGKHRYKETEGGLNAMCEIMEKIAKEERAEGKLELLIDLVKDGIISIA